MTSVESLVRDEIRAQGAMRFDRFMELALYHPEHGYYATPRPVGRSGDFFTSVSVGPLFGRLLAWQAREMAELLAESEFWIVEQGAHDGRLAHDILTEAKTIPAFWNRLRYLIIEPSERLRAAQSATLQEFREHLVWWQHGESCPGERPAGFFFSNELVDALPVRLIEARDGRWWERAVTIAVDGALGWKLIPTDRALDDAIRALPLVAVDGYRTELRLAGQTWMKQTAEILRRGYAMTIDYGFSASLYYAPFRREGCLTCYRQHQRGDDVLRSPGEQDITAHVDFTALAQAGEAAGLKTLAFLDQMHFLTGILQGQIAQASGPGFDPSRDFKAWQTLTHPEHLGQRFKVLLQSKDAPPAVSGAFHARAGGLD